MKILTLKDDITKILDRSPSDYQDAIDTARKIIEEVSKNGDEALIKYSKKFDNIELTKKNIQVNKSEIKKAYEKVDEEVIKSLKKSKKNISKYHKKQFEESSTNWMIETEEEVEVGEKTNPLQSVGCYIPGGKAAYPTSVLMTAIPAKIAGVQRIVVVSPPPINPAVLVACDLCDVDEVYQIGGAQSIAALAKGTETIEKVDKIVGPGNKYVTSAKMLCYGQVDIDMPAGPSEILIIADEKANPSYITWDILAQAEHDPNAQCILVTLSENLAEEVNKQINTELEEILRKDILLKSKENITILKVETMSQAIEFANNYGAEHLEIMAANPDEIEKQIHNAGAIFVGENSPVAAGDYSSGANHVLPTGGASRYSSQLSVRDFLKTSSIQKISKNGIKKLSKTITTLAETEGLTAHKKSVEERI